MNIVSFTPQDAGAMVRWVLNRPPLLALGKSAHLPAPGQLDLEALAQQLGRTQRLGQRFEWLVAAILAGSGRYQILAKDSPLVVDKRTLGAPDLILRDNHSGQLEHWELTVKFYLGLPQGWLGPGQRDWLEHKASHLARQQLPLLSTPQAQGWLAERGWAISERRLLSRGLLFGQGPAHDWLAQGHEQGSWFRLGELPAGRWYGLARWQWLAEVDTAQLVPFNGITDQPLMLLDANTGLRHMLVPSDWPQEKGEP
ncbi:DUF1853 family protein [Gallaecimonas xiamenensis]|nr:DUF1853 family protein [Gallaecimonas xiamenensis]